jgi:acyl-CoA thioester hydrolase
MGHVNNAVYLTYLEVARFAYWRDVADGRSTGEAGVIMARAEIDYKAPATYKDRLEVRTAITGFGRTSFVFEYEIVDQTGRLIATAKTIQVFYDYQAEKPVAVPPGYRALIEAYEAGRS